LRGGKRGKLGGASTACSSRSGEKRGGTPRSFKRFESAIRRHTVGKKEIPLLSGGEGGEGEVAFASSRGRKENSVLRPSPPTRRKSDLSTSFPGGGKEGERWLPHLKEGFVLVRKNTPSTGKEKGEAGAF